jgi:hypothetical protein
MRGCGRSSAGAESLTETQGHSDAAREASCLRLGELGAHRFLRAAFWDWYRQAVGRCILAPPLPPLSPEYRGEGGELESRGELTANKESSGRGGELKSAETSTPIRNTAHHENSSVAHRFTSGCISPASRTETVTPQQLRPKPLRFVPDTFAASTIDGNPEQDQRLLLNLSELT